MTGKSIDLSDPLKLLDYLKELKPLAGVDWGEPIQSQYSASPRIIALAKAMAGKLDNLDAIRDFFQLIYNVQTAQGYGLDVWARIVGLPSRKIYVASSDVFGFESTPETWKPFDQAPFYNAEIAAGMVELSDDVLRWFILYKAMSNISGETMLDLNTLLKEFAKATTGTGNAYVLEIGVMQIRVVFEYVLNDVEFALLTQYGLLNKGAGVGVEFELLTIDPPVFGFVEDSIQTGIFGEAPFYAGGIIA